jgi:hypothetical protein
LHLVAGTYGPGRESRHTPMRQWVAISPSYALPVRSKCVLDLTPET